MYKERIAKYIPSSVWVATTLLKIMGNCAQGKSVPIKNKAQDRKRIQGDRKVKSLYAETATMLE